MAYGKGLVARIGLCISVMFLCASGALAAPYAAMVMDARSGEVLHSSNADARLHPASLTKMMTLYIAFEAVEHGEISLDTQVRISRRAASEPPSKLGLREGQKIALRHLIRAAAIKSANDAATAIAEAIEGSEAAFARRMNRTAKGLGMTRTTFKNAHGLTEDGHLSTARDMTILGRHVLYDYPEYYNLFSRQSSEAAGRRINNTNRRFLSSYRGADGIKTGYTRAAGFNLVASAERGSERIIATVFGGRSTATRNQRVAELLDLGFKQAPSQVALRKPGRPAYGASEGGNRMVTLVERSLRPLPRPTAAPAAPPAEVLVALQDGIAATLAELDLDEGSVEEEFAEEAVAMVAIAAEAGDRPDAEALAEATSAAPVTTISPRPRPETILEAVAVPEPRPEVDTDSEEPPVQLASVEPEREVVTRLSTSGGRHWGINVGRYGSRYQAEKVLLQTALIELSTLDEALRKVVKTSRGFDANFVGMSEEQAALVCRRLAARNIECTPLGPG